MTSQESKDTLKLESTIPTVNSKLNLVSEEGKTHSPAMGAGASGTGNIRTLRSQGSLSSSTPKRSSGLPKSPSQPNFSFSVWARDTFDAFDVEVEDTDDIGHMMSGNNDDNDGNNNAIGLNNNKRRSIESSSLSISHNQRYSIDALPTVLGDDIGIIRIKSGIPSENIVRNKSVENVSVKTDVVNTDNSSGNNKSTGESVSKRLSFARLWSSTLRVSPQRLYAQGSTSNDNKNV